MSEYEIRLEIKDANGKPFGGVTKASPEMLDRVLEEMSKSAFDFFESDWQGANRKRLGCERLGIGARQRFSMEERRTYRRRRSRKHRSLHRKIERWGEQVRRDENGILVQDD